VLREDLSVGQNMVQKDQKNSLYIIYIV
jgi:hypothetical protein